MAEGKPEIDISFGIRAGREALMGSPTGGAAMAGLWIPLFVVALAGVGVWAIIRMPTDPITWGIGIVLFGLGIAGFWWGSQYWRQRLRVWSNGESRIDLGFRTFRMLPGGLQVVRVQVHKVAKHNIWMDNDLESGDVDSYYLGIVHSGRTTRFGPMADQGEAEALRERVWTMTRK